MNYIRYILILFIPLALATGCKSKKVITETDEIKPRNAGYLVKKINFENEDYETLQAELSFDGRFGNTRQRVRGDLKHIRDSVIWISATKFGFEIGRVMITPDSFYLLDRLNREYLAEPITYIEEISGIDTDFYLLQDLLVGRISYAQPPALSSAVKENMYYLVGSSLYSGITLESYLDVLDYSVRRLIYKDYRDRTLKINYLEPGRKGDYLTDRQFETVDPYEEEIDIKLYFEEVVKDKPLKYRFDVPPRYDRI